MFLAALIIASKYATDRALSSGTWATHIIGQNNGIRNVSEVNSIQQEFLSIMEYELFIEHENFNHWMDELKEYTILKYKYLSVNDQKQALQWKAQQSYWFKRFSIAANMKHSKLNNVNSPLTSSNTLYQNTTSTTSYKSTPKTNANDDNPFLVLYQNKTTSLPSPTSPITKKCNSTPSSQIIPAKQVLPNQQSTTNTANYPRYAPKCAVNNNTTNNNATLTPLSNISTPFVPNKQTIKPMNVSQSNYQNITNCNNKRARSISENYPLEKKIKYSNQVIPTPPSNSRMFININ